MRVRVTSRKFAPSQLLVNSRQVSAFSPKLLLVRVDLNNGTVNEQLENR